MWHVHELLDEIIDFWAVNIVVIYDLMQKPGGLFVMERWIINQKHMKDVTNIADE